MLTHWRKQNFKIKIFFGAGIFHNSVPLINDLYLNSKYIRKYERFNSYVEISYPSYQMVTILVVNQLLTMWVETCIK